MRLDTGTVKRKDSDTEHQLKLLNVTKRFGDVLAVDNVSLAVHFGEFITLLGPSGSGKTTTLNIIAGFDLPTSGQVFLENRDITTVAPYNREVGMVFQNYALFPHMTVFENIAFPLRMRKISANQICQQIREVLELVKLPGLEKRYPNQLSGGQQQRIALARALVFRPRILLMDEPLGALDKKLRDHMRLEIKHLQESLNITVIYVTHDQEEALTMSDRIAIMNEGQIIQVNSPATLYESPANLFVADFVGESNFLIGRVVETDHDGTVVETNQRMRVRAKKRTSLKPGEEVIVAIRPEKIQILSDKIEVPVDIVNRFSGRVEEVVYLGDADFYQICVAPEFILQVKVQSGPLASRHRRGDEVVIGWQACDGLALNSGPLGHNSNTEEKEDAR